MFNMAFMDRQKAHSRQLIRVPKRFAGRWIVWNGDRTSIIASGGSLNQAQEAARSAGETNPGFEWVPPADRRLIGPVR